MPEKHLSSQFDSELNSASARVMELGGLVESQLRQAIYALTQFSSEAADQVIETEQRVNAMEVEIDFAFGKGPKAQGSSRAYPVFVTVTRRDRTVLAKERFDVNVTFPPGMDTVRMTEKIPGIVIPRANDTVSGTNFEVVVGFDLTPEQVAYNRSGTRFTINVAPPAKPK